MKFTRHLIFGAAVVLIGDVAGAQPMQISPPLARPPANVPAKPKVKAAVKKPALKKSIAEPAQPKQAPSMPCI